jgi:hypothetical protein
VKFKQYINLLSEGKNINEAYFSNGIGINENDLRKTAEKFLKSIKVYGEDIQAKKVSNGIEVEISFFEDSDAEEFEKKLMKDKYPELEEVLDDYEVDGNVVTLIMTHIPE